MAVPTDATPLAVSRLLTITGGLFGFITAPSFFCARTTAALAGK
jgi:hypothetical protein